MSYDTLFTTSAGAKVLLLSAKDLIKIPIWRGNRILDRTHVEEIKKDVGPHVCLLDHNYHIACILETDAAGHEIKQRYIIDGQHRHQVLKNHFEETLFTQDFPVLVFELDFPREIHLIEHFNTLNRCKPIKPMEDENLILNSYVQALSLALGEKMFRSGACHRPNLSIDKLREGLRNQFALLPKTEKGIAAFASRAKAYNDQQIADDTFVLGIQNEKKCRMFEKGLKMGFVLAYDDKLPWIQTVLREIAL
jgi:hypothetical protein